MNHVQRIQSYGEKLLKETLGHISKSAFDQNNMGNAQIVQKYLDMKHKEKL